MDIVESLTSDDVLGDGGIFEKNIDNYSPRSAQLQMAKAIEQSLKYSKHLVVEAATGTGKTFAYIVPALLADQKVIISTGTKHLQDQIFHRDLPTVVKALNFSVKTALLKGRANYLCLHRFERSISFGEFTTKQQVKELQSIRRWYTYTDSGDIAEVSDISEQSLIWPLVTSSVDNCLGSDCEFFQKCYVNRARQQAQQAQVLVINHHLFCSDLALKDSGMGEILPGAGIMVLDEAHQLSEIASNFFGNSLSNRKILDFCDDVERAGVLDAKDMVELANGALRLRQGVNELQLVLSSGETRGIWQQVSHQPSVQNAITKLKQYFEDVQQSLEQAAQRSTELSRCKERCDELVLQFTQLTTLQEHTQIHWYETSKYGFRIHLTPLEVAEQFQQYLNDQKVTWIFTSATLSVDDSFEHFIKELGVDEAEQLQLESPFDFEKQSLLYVPRGLPDVSQQQFIPAMADAIIPVIKACQGRTFVLFTSHRHLQAMAELLASELDMSLLVQGAKPKSELLREFLQTKHAVLLGTSSFWEGVDVKGQALSCVIIDKLPFASPFDPIMKARLNSLRQQGLSPFDDYQLPKAVINLKQGVGRLIRDHQDHGVIMICDPRLLGREYGRVFLQSLPNMQRTRDLQRTLTFIENLPEKPVHDAISH